ncbi:MAG: hypothetical protein ACXADC_10605 [Candidatus Thorarchaeota archaeon]|jgi:hypothetical protein
MEIFLTLGDAKAHATSLARAGRAPTIYELGTGEYVTVQKGKWPPPNSSPILKWSGSSDGWIPILTRLDSVSRAQEACGLFSLLGHEPIIVEFPGITYDVFLKEAHIPGGAWIILESDGAASVRHLQSPRFYDEEESEDVNIHLSTT